MVIRTLALSAGLIGALGASQFPEYSQQYVQRLGGAVDELWQVVERFDIDAETVGLTRHAALEQLATGGEFGAARAASMRATIGRYEDLAEDLAALQGTGPFLRLTMTERLSDPDIASRAWAAYRPAVPTTGEGFAFAGAGFVAAWLLVLALFDLLAVPFRRRRHMAEV